ncbi:MAG: hypothetical protein IJI35_13945 [Kiritimatiellae bacterium]|nr:hypothetical protein [Kiritimatiellia bacterium]
MLPAILAAEILVGVTGYGESPEFAEVVTNGECNLFVQWARSENLIPGESKLMTPELFEKAKENRIRVMTIYGNQDGRKSKALKDAWGDLYLGNNIGEYAGFLYQDERSYSAKWPKCRDLREAHDWLVGSMLAAPRKAQLARPADEREPCLFSTSGSPLACYELEGGIDEICSEMYAVGCGNLAYATAEARGAARRHGRAKWSAWLAHEWQTCWPRLPYGVAQKQDSLEVGLKEMWLMGTSMMVLESGSQTTQAQDYTPPDGLMSDFKSPKQGYGGEIPAAYRRTMRGFYRWTKEHPRAEGSPVVDAALLVGNLDGYVGMTHDIFAVFGQHHIAATNANWRCGAPEFTWEAVMETFFPRPADALRPFANGWLGGTPHGQLDVVNVDDGISADRLSRYGAVAFGGWNTMTPKIAAALRDYVASGGQVALCVPQMSSRVDREFSEYTDEDIVQAVPGVAVGGPVAVEDILMVGGDAPPFLRRAYPAHLQAKLRVADVKLGESAVAVATMGRRPYLVRAAHGKGFFWLCLAWDYPAARREREEFPSFRSFRLDFWKTLLVGIVDSLPRSRRVSGAEADYVNWAVYPDGTMYLLNTDCVGSRTVLVDGRETTLGPKEMREVRP